MAAGTRPATRLYIAAAAVYLADRLTKIWAAASLARRPPITVIPGVLQLNYTTNAGGAFGLGEGWSLLFAVATIVVSVVIVIASFRGPRTLPAVALGLVLGGALGNLTDRIVRGPGLSGRVVDFIDFHVWPVFNLADSAIVVGVGLLVVAGAFQREPA